MERTMLNYLKIYLDTDLKIILLNYKNNCLERLSIASKKF